MQCSECKRWYGWAMTDEYPTQGWGCAAFASNDGKLLHGAYGSFALDGDTTRIIREGCLAPGAVLCDYCYMQGVKRGDFDIAWEQEDRDPTLVAALESDTIHVMVALPGYVSLLCAWEERWVFEFIYDTNDDRHHFAFVCIGHPEQSDVKTTGIYGEPAVVALREHIYEEIKRIMKK